MYVDPGFRIETPRIAFLCISGGRRGKTGIAGLQRVRRFALGWERPHEQPLSELSSPMNETDAPPANGQTAAGEVQTAATCGQVPRGVLITGAHVHVATIDPDETPRSP